MALEATHLRFALDLREKYKIKDLDAYLSGTVYPDSRYVTGIDRVLTHPKNFKLKFIPKNDFEKGWKAHLDYDKSQGKIITSLLGIKEKEIEQGDKNWIDITAIKLLQDIADFPFVDFGETSKHLKFVSNPNNESREDLIKYYSIINETYNNKHRMQIEDYNVLMHGLGIFSEVENSIYGRCRKFGEDKELMKKVGEIYDTLISLKNRK